MIEPMEGIRHIPGQDEMIPDSHTYVVGLPSSQDLSLVDPGLVGKGKVKIEALRRSGIDLASIKRVILTHTHFDHIGCLSEIRKQLPGTQLWVHETEAEALERGDERTVYGMEMFRTMCQMQYGLKKGAYQFQVDRKLRGGETLEVGGMAWEVIHIPGHSTGSIGLYHGANKILVPGDVIYAGYAIGRFDLHGANPGELKRSLLRLAELEVDVLLPGHNQIVRKLPAGYIRETAKQWEAYLT